MKIELLINSPFHPSNDKDLYVKFLYHYEYIVFAINQELAEAKEAGTEIQVSSNDA